MILINNFKINSIVQNHYKVLINIKKVVHCYGCGSNTHTHGSTHCPVKGKCCDYCKKPNHFASVCLKNKPKTQPTTDEQSKAIQQIIRESDSEDDYCFNINQPKLDILVKLDEKKVPFMIDSGASCSIIDSDTFDQLAQSKNVYLEQPAARVYVYNSRNPLELHGSFFSVVSVGNNKHIAKLLVSKGKSSGCLLGRLTATKLSVLQIHQVNEIHISNNSNKVSTILNVFPKVTSGLGKLKNTQVKLSIDNTVKPMSQHLRQVPFHIQKKNESKIDELLKLDIIEPVSETSSWVSPLLAVPKPKTVDDVKIVIDMQKTNTAIKRTHHPITTADGTFEKFNQCTVFSKIDLLHGYHQIELHPESIPITTFSLHKGLFQRFAQGANAAFEEYQHEIGQLFINEKHIANISDNILIGSIDTQNHDENVRGCFQILKENGLTTNLKKYLFRKTEISFFGFKISSDGIKPMDDKIDAIMNFKEPTNVKEVRSFLGLVNFMSRFIDHLSSKTAIIRKLTSKKCQMEMGISSKINYLKNLAMKDRTFTHFNQFHEMFLIVDAGLRE